MKKTKSGKRGARLGQHFLTGTWAAAKLAESAKIGPGDVVLEIGPGKGALTRELLNIGARVVAVEKDQNLVHLLREKFAGDIATGRLTLIQDDIRNFDPSDHGLVASGYVLAANIPYYITGEILRTFLSAHAQPNIIAVLVQKEVAERITHSTKESILSLSVKAYGTPHIAARVSRGNFSPPPSVDSAILIIERISRDLFRSLQEKDFFDVVRAGFASKRKFLSGNLGARFGRERTIAALRACGIPEKARAEDVPLKAWLCLTQQLGES